MPAKSVLLATQAAVEMPPPGLAARVREGKPADLMGAMNAVLPALPEVQFETQSLALETTLHGSGFLPAHEALQRC